MDPFQGVLPFIRVAEGRSFGGAARQLGVTTAAVSKAISRLEASLGVDLLVRTSRSVALTPEGTVFLERCRHALEDVQAGRDQLAAANPRVEGPVRLSLSPILGKVVVSGLSELARVSPGLTFELSVTDRFTGLVEEGIDVAVRIGALEDSSLRARTLAQPRWVTVAAPGYLAERGLPRTPADLATHDCLQFVTPRGALRAWLFSGPTPSPALAPPRLRIDNGEMLVVAALAGMGVCQVLEFMVAQHVREGRLVEVLGDVSAPGPVIRALWLSRRKDTPRIRVVLDLLGQLFAREALGGRRAAAKPTG